MNKSIRISFAVVSLAIGVIPDSFGFGHEVVRTDKFDLNIGGRTQLVGYGQYVNDPIKDKIRLYLFLKQARLNLNGRLEAMERMDVQYN
ncbi:MAG: hypothetical protein HYZ73_04540, partial [Elusimicrobia bacterium]|nr:hypothetical protein [Elusimicrobiota bacterium]